MPNHSHQWHIKEFIIPLVPDIFFYLLTYMHKPSIYRKSVHCFKTKGYKPCQKAISFEGVTDLKDNWKNLGYLKSTTTKTKHINETSIKNKHKK